MSEEDSLIKHREIGFRGPHPDPHQARSAMLLLSDVEGVQNVSLLSERAITVSYDIRLLTFVELEEALQEVGFHLDQNLLFKLRKALYQYTESTQRANLGLDPQVCSGNCAQKVFVRHYRNRAHGCRDDRPAHWRKYL